MMADPSMPSYADGILLVRTAAETDIVESSSAIIDGARSEQIKLRHLASVERQIIHFCFSHIYTHASGGSIDRDQF